ncbi:MAG: type II toxin-antitoxin system HigB family toxin [Candidatus Sedimenticola sp. (ex Thyasira tokunagai)]
MQVIGRDKLVKFSRKHSEAKAVLDAWYDEVGSDTCIWTAPHDITNRFPKASILGKKGERVVFRIKGNHIRLIVQVSYRAGRVLIERVGTHAEYDKWNL